MKRNLLISRPDNRTYVDENGNFRPAFHIIERDSYTPIEGGSGTRAAPLIRPSGPGAGGRIT